MQRHGQLSEFVHARSNSISGVITTRGGRAVLSSRHSLRVLTRRDIKLSLPRRPVPQTIASWNLWRFVVIQLAQDILFS